MLEFTTDVIHFVLENQNVLLYFVELLQLNLSFFS